jgi:hypothetical protein
MDLSQLPNDETREMLRDSVRGFLAGNWNAGAAAPADGLPEAIAAIWT